METSGGGSTPDSPLVSILQYIESHVSMYVEDATISLPSNHTEDLQNNSIINLLRPQDRLLLYIVDTNVSALLCSSFVCMMKKKH